MRPCLKIIAKRKKKCGRLLPCAVVSLALLSPSLTLLGMNEQCRVTESWRLGIGTQQQGRDLGSRATIKILSWPCPTEFWSDRNVLAGHCDCRLSFRLKFSCLSLLCAMMMGVYYHTQPEFVIQLRRI